MLRRTTYGTEVLVEHELNLHLARDLEQVPQDTP
jgi:hypothetical protein